MFAATGLLKQIRCPLGERCSLTNCLFSHDFGWINGEAHGEKTKQDDKTAAKHSTTKEPLAKRQKIDTFTDDGHGSQAAKTGLDVSATSNSEAGRRSRNVSDDRSTRVEPPSSTSKESRLVSVIRSVSPPKRSTRNQIPTRDVKAKMEKAEALNPRLLPHDPAGHNKRMVYLTALYKELQRLNAAVSKHEDQNIKRLELDDAALTKVALDEEEKLAREQPAVYANVIKMQIVKYRKMTESEWIDIRRKHEDAKKPKLKHAKPIHTGLTPAEEVEVLRSMVTAQNGLHQWGYVTTPPTEEAIESARLGVQAADGYENCDRCRSRFQVFPDRREDGMLTSGGKCIHHWGKPVYPKRQKTDAQTGQQEPRYSCCNELLGTRGCTEGNTHVFKITDPKRLAAVLPFAETGIDSIATAYKAVCFDCEMGYTVYGLELIRVTAVSWPEGHALLDVLVKPVGAILDLNSRFSGVFPEHIANANEMDVAAWKTHTQSTNILDSKGRAEVTLKDLEIVPSPAVARELLMHLLDKDTLLIGHALENDLNAIRLIHPNIVDTVFLYPHPRGMPIRYGLRQLALQHLERHIQAAGAAGHSSLEDARATGDVARWKVKTEWDKLRLDGWTIKDGVFYGPAVGGGEAVPAALWLSTRASVHSGKRKLDELQSVTTATAPSVDK